MLSMTLERLSHGTVTERFELKGERRKVYKLGRVASADVFVDDPLASRLHAIIDLSQKRAILRDMGTAVGTTLNGQKISRATLKTDDVITIGDTSFHVVMARGTEKPPPIPSGDERRRERLIDAMATLTPHSADQLKLYADFLKKNRKRPIVRHHDDQSEVMQAIVDSAAAKVAGEDDEPTVMEVRDSQILEAIRPEPASAEARPEKRVDTAELRSDLANQKRRTHWLAGALAVGVLLFAALPFRAPSPEAIRAAVPTAVEQIREAAPAAVHKVEQVAQAAPAAIEQVPAVLEQVTEKVAALAPLPRRYTVKPGDTIGSIAKRELGSAAAWERLWQHNEATLPNPSMLEVGMVLEIPTP